MGPGGLNSLHLLCCRNECANEQAETAGTEGSAAKTALGCSDLLAREMADAPSQEFRTPSARNQAAREAADHLARQASMVDLQNKDFMLAGFPPLMPLRLRGVISLRSLSPREVNGSSTSNGVPACPCKPADPATQCRSLSQEAYILERFSDTLFRHRLGHPRVSSSARAETVDAFRRVFRHYVGSVPRTTTTGSC